MTTNSLPYFDIPSKTLEVIQDLVDMSLNAAAHANRSDFQIEICQRLEAFEAANIAVLKSIEHLIAKTAIAVSRTQDQILSKRFAEKLNDFYENYWLEATYRIHLFELKKKGTSCQTTPLK